MKNALVSAAAFAVVAAFAAPALAADPTAPAQGAKPSVYDTAMGLFHTKKYKEALALLDPYLAEHPSDARALALRGDVKSDLGDDRAALVDYNSAIVADPDYEYAYVTRCQTRSTLDDAVGALADCNQAVKLDAKDSLAYESRADVYFDQAQYPLALADYSKAIELDQPGAYVYAARCDTRRVLGDYAAAALDCEKARQLDPQSRRGYWAQARLALATKRYRDALPLFTAYIAQNPNESTTAYYFRGLVYNRLTNYASALDNLKIYVERDPRDGDGYRERAVARYGLGDKDGALSDLDLAESAYKRDGAGEAADSVGHMREAVKAGTALPSD